MRRRCLLHRDKVVALLEAGWLRGVDLTRGRQNYNLIGKKKYRLGINALTQPLSLLTFVGAAAWRAVKKGSEKRTRHLLEVFDGERG